MTDREKVIKALEICIPINDGEECPKECPRRAQDTYCAGYGSLMRDALELLKEQEEQIKQLEYDLAVAQDNLHYYINGND